ncbi:GntR family transcriptional regulator [Flaviflagellibacter deserti]|uniref:GntR family transcriptional regulator n=1 Tax=Flaviflagellibacter deserti TaxID=2267266 RepID=A0ABV9Z5Y3_9HYPH
MPSEQDQIEASIIAAVLAGRFRPGTRLGESVLAGLYGVSRTLVREALMRLQTRGIVQVSARRGWFIVEPSAGEAHAAYEARKVIETGLMLSIGQIPPETLKHLREHVEAEHSAIQGPDVTSRVCLLGDFHVHLAEAFGNPVLTEILQNLTARTTLISMLYQSSDAAEESSDDHGIILDALEAGDLPLAAKLMAEHLDRVEAGLDLTARTDPLADLRDILVPGTSDAKPSSAKTVPDEPGPDHRKPINQIK